MPKRKRNTTKAREGWASTRDRRGVIKQAESDVERGLQDTGRRSRTAVPRKARSR